MVTSTTQKSLRGPRGGFILSNNDLARGIDFGVFPFTQGGPFMHVIAAKAVCFGEAMGPEFARYAGPGGGQLPGAGAGTLGSRGAPGLQRQLTTTWYLWT